MHLLIPEHPLWPLVQEYFRQLYEPDTLHLITVGYFTEPSLQNASLYRFHSLDAYGEQFDYTLCDEASVLQALPTWIYSIDCQPENTLPYRAFVFSPGKIEDASSLQSFLDATGTPVFVRQQLLDNRDHRYDEYLTAENDPYDPAAFSHYLYSCADRDNIDADGLRNALKEYREKAEYSAERDSGRIFTGEDPLLSALSVPAFTHYAGRIETREDLDIVMMFYYHSYRSYEYGLAAYAAVAESPEGWKISNERDIRISEKILKIREAIEAASSLPLTLLKEESTR